MTGSLLAERLAARGLDRSELAAKRSLYDLIIATFLNLHRAAPVHAWWVPGRLEVFGKHTDYAGGRSLLAAVPRGVAVVAGPRADGTLTVRNARTRERLTLPSGERVSRGPDWRHYVEVAVRRLARNFPGRELAGDIVFASDLPVAAGMSSSTALVVSVATAVSRLADFETHAEWKSNLRESVDVAAYFACVENGRTFKSLAGDAGVGTHGGSEDHVALLCARPGHLSAYAFAPIRHLATVRLPEDWRFVIATSSATAEKTGAARDAFNRLARDTERLLAIWNKAGNTAPSLGAALASAPEARDRLTALIRHAGSAGSPLEQRLAAFVREDARVPAALEAFATHDAAALGRLAAGSQADAESLLGNQVPETIALARFALEQGARAACSFGAGFGGSVWAMVDRAAAAGFPARWLSGHPELGTAAETAFIAVPGPPVTELTGC